MYNPNTFDIVKNTGYFHTLDEIFPGCTISLPDREEEVLKSFKTKAEALEALNEYKSNLFYVEVMHTHFYVEEYSLRISETDDDGEFLDGCDYEPAKFNLNDIDFIIEYHCYYDDAFTTKFRNRFK